MNTEEIIIKMGLNSGVVSQGIRSVKHEVTELGSHLKGALGGLVGVAAFEELARSTVEYGSKVNDLSLRLGISTDAVQQWDYALKQSGSSIEAAVPFFEKLAVARHKALAGNEEAVAAFTKLGVSMASLKSDRLEDIAATIGKTFQAGDPQNLLASLREIGGRGAGQLVAAFRDGLTDMFKDAPIISQSNIEELDKIHDKFAKLKAEFMTGFAPAVTGLFNLLNETLALLQTTMTATVGSFSGMLEKLTGSDLVDAMRNPGKAARGLVKGVAKAALLPVPTAIDLLRGGMEGSSDALQAMKEMNDAKAIAEMETRLRKGKAAKKKDFSDPEAESAAAETAEKERKKDEADERKDREQTRKDTLEILKAEAGDNQLLYAQQKLLVDDLAAAEAAAADDKEHALRLEHELRLDVLAVQKAQTNHAEKQAKFDSDLANAKQSKSDARIEKYMPKNLEEIANSQLWDPEMVAKSKQQKQLDELELKSTGGYKAKFAKQAQELVLAEQDAQRAFDLGGGKSERFLKDQENIQSLKKGLSEAGLIKRDAMENMDKNIADLLKRAEKEGLVVQSVNAT